MSVFFVWFKWRPNNLDDDSKMLICELANAKGMKDTVVQLLPGRRDVVLMALISIGIGGIFVLFENYLNFLGRDNWLVAIFLKVFLALFVWAIVQLPIYYFSLILARFYCTKWIKEQLKIGYKPITCKMICKVKNDSMLLWDESYTINSLLESASHMSKDIKNREVDTTKIAELMIRLLLNAKDSNLNVPTETIKMALANLAILFDVKPKLSDTFCFCLDLNGEITGTLTRNGSVMRNCQFGFLPLT